MQTDGIGANFIASSTFSVCDYDETLPKTPEDYRSRAAACERLAASATSAESHEIMYFLAMRWRDLADEAEGEITRADRPNHCPPAKNRAPMKTPNELRAEAAWLREFAGRVTDREALEEIQVMIAELDRRARALGDGDAGEC